MKTKTTCRFSVVPFKAVFGDGAPTIIMKNAYRHILTAVYLPTPWISRISHIRLRTPKINFLNPHPSRVFQNQATNARTWSQGLPQIKPRTFKIAPWTFPKLSPRTSEIELSKSTPNLPKSSLKLLTSSSERLPYQDPNSCNRALKLSQFKPLNSRVRISIFPKWS